MAYILPQTTDTLASKTHSLLHRIIAVDDASPEQSLLVNSSGSLILNQTHTLIGGAASADNLILQSTSHATKGKILFGTSAYDEVNNRLGIGTTTPLYKTHIVYEDSVGGVPGMLLENTGAAAGNMFFLSRRTSNGNLGIYRFNGIDSGSTERTFAAFGGAMTSRTAGDIKGSLIFQVAYGTNSLDTRMALFNEGLRIGSGTAPTARLHLDAGTATASTAPLKFTSGTNLTTAEAGAFEFDGTELYFTPSTTRKIIPTVPTTRPSGYSITGGYTADRAFDPEITSLTEIARAIGTLIDDIKLLGLITA